MDKPERRIEKEDGEIITINERKGFNKPKF